MLADRSGSGSREPSGRTRIACFINRQIGTRVALDLESLPGVDLVAVIVHDAGEQDVDFTLFSKATRFYRWSEFLSWCLEDQPVFNFGVSALFGKVIPNRVFKLFSEGIVNLHPSLLPYGRGKHPATWAIWEETPYGVSAHLVTEEIDGGPLLGQVKVSIKQCETSAALYSRGLEELWNLYRASVKPWLLGEPTELTPQPPGGSSHRAQDLERLYQLARDTTLSDEDRRRLLRALSLG